MMISTSKGRSIVVLVTILLAVSNDLAAGTGYSVEPSLGFGQAELGRAALRPPAREDLDSLAARAEALELRRKGAPFRFAAKMSVRFLDRGKARTGVGSLWSEGERRVRMSMTFPIDETTSLRSLVVADGKDLWTRTFRRKNGEAKNRAHGLKVTRLPLEQARSGPNARLRQMAELPQTNPVVLIRQIRERFRRVTITRVGKVYLVKGEIPAGERQPAGDSEEPRPARVELRLSVAHLIVLGQTITDERGTELSSMKLEELRTAVKSFKAGTFEMKVPEGVEVEVLDPSKSDKKKSDKK